MHTHGLYIHDINLVGGHTAYSIHGYGTVPVYVDREEAESREESRGSKDNSRRMHRDEGNHSQCGLRGKEHLVYPRVRMKWIQVLLGLVLWSRGLMERGLTCNKGVMAALSDTDTQPITPAGHQRPPHLSA